MGNFLTQLEHIITKVSEVIWPVFVPFMLVLGAYMAFTSITKIHPKMTKPSKMKFKNMIGPASISLGAMVGTGAIVGVLGAISKLYGGGQHNIEAIVAWAMIGALVMIPVSYCETVNSKIMKQGPREYISKLISPKLGFFYAISIVALCVFGFTLPQSGAIGIIGGADGPTSIYVTSKLAPELLGAIAVAAYSYMALVPVIQPPIMRLLTTKEERQIQMSQLREVSKREKIVFPLVVLGLCIIFLPDACPLVGMLTFGNLCKECGVVERLSDTMQNALINIVTIFLGLAVGLKLQYAHFLTLETLKILVLGIIAFSVATAAGVLMAKFMNLFSKTKINPLIGSAGVSAVPMAARVANKVGLEANPQNFLLMHAMGPNVAGVIGSAVAAGVLLALCH